MALTRILPAPLSLHRAALLFTVFALLSAMLLLRLIVVPLSVPCDAETHAQLDLNHDLLWDSAKHWRREEPDY